MKQREYISPSGINTWFSDGPEAFYLKYLADTKLENEPQTQPMSIGSAFDAYCKNYLYECLFGKDHSPLFEFNTIFETQVEPHNRDWARVHGLRCFEDYTRSGALADLLSELEKATSTPRFEFTVQGGITCKEFDTSGLVLLGKPDCYFHNKEKYPVVLDWKVNGWCSNFNKSPLPGYVKLRHCDGTTPKSSHHKDAVLSMKNGVLVNLKKRLEEAEESWAGQLSVYGWLCGEAVGSEFLTCIDQLVCKPTGGFPIVRVAEHRTWVSSEFQLAYAKKAKEMWDIIHSDHIFRDLSFEESAVRCRTLDRHTEDAKEQSGTEEDAIFKQLTRTKTW